jgi:hypothetical protein
VVRKKKEKGRRISADTGCSSLGNSDGLLQLSEKRRGIKERRPDPVAVRSKTWVCGRSLVQMVGSNPARGMDVFLMCVYIFR